PHHAPTRLLLTHTVLYCPLSYRHPQDLHSFPTRRSSDLPLSTFMSVVLPAPFSPSSPWISPRAAVKSTPARATVSPNRLAMSDIDRKSTRLNSSHGSISYAVFCLKKKKERKQILYAVARL